MTRSDLNKLIEDEVSSVITKPIVAAESNSLREPQAYKPPRPVYRPVLKTEEEIDHILFYGGNKPEDE